MEDRVRITRVYVFDGPRGDVERTIQKSLPDGSHTRTTYGLPGVGPRGDGEITIHAFTLGRFPERLPAPPAPRVLDLGGDKWLLLRKEENYYGGDFLGLTQEADAAGCIGIAWWFPEKEAYIFDKFRRADSQPTEAAPAPPTTDILDPRD